MKKKNKLKINIKPKKYRKIYRIELTETQLNMLIAYLGDLPEDGNLQVGVIHPLFNVIRRKKMKIDLKNFQDKQKRINKLFNL